MIVLGYEMQGCLEQDMPKALETAIDACPLLDRLSPLDSPLGDHRRRATVLFELVLRLQSEALNRRLPSTWSCRFRATSLFDPTVNEHAELQNTVAHWQSLIYLEQRALNNAYAKLFQDAICWRLCLGTSLLFVFTERALLTRRDSGLETDKALCTSVVPPDAK